MLDVTAMRTMPRMVAEPKKAPSSAVPIAPSSIGSLAMTREGGERIQTDRHGESLDGVVPPATSSSPGALAGKQVAHIPSGVECSDAGSLEEATTCTRAASNGTVLSSNAADGKGVGDQKRTAARALTIQCDLITGIPGGFKRSKGKQAVLLGNKPVFTPSTPPSLTGVGSLLASSAVMTTAGAAAGVQGPPSSSLAASIQSLAIEGIMDIARLALGAGNHNHTVSHELSKNSGGSVIEPIGSSPLLEERELTDPIEAGLPVPSSAGLSPPGSTPGQSSESERLAAKAAILATLAGDAAHGLPLGPEKRIITAMWERDIRTALQVEYVGWCHKCATTGIQVGGT